MRATAPTLELGVIRGGHDGPSLTGLRGDNTTAADALDYFDALPTLAPAQLLGRWRGEGVPTGHPQDGVLEQLGWYGKDFVGLDDVHPLLFGAEDRLFDVDARLLQLAARPGLRPGPLLASLFRRLRPLLTTTRPRARLRSIEHRGQLTAAMIYDHLPIIDVFRAVDDDTVLGLMDQRGAPQPFFFLLRRR